MSPPPAVLVIGSIMQDLTLACDHFPAAGQTIIARLRTGQGGKGSNQAIACGRTGVPTLFIGAAGGGGFAGSVREFYSREKIGCRLVEKPKCSSGTAVILLNREGQNQIVIEPGANQALSPTDLPSPLPRSAKVLVVQLESNLATTMRALRLARKARVTTVLNPAPMRPDFDPAMLRDVDILIPNETEFAALVRALPAAKQPHFTEESLHTLSAPSLHGLCRRFGVPTVIITLGRKGCFISTPEGHRTLPIYRKVKVSDTTGAGDAFCGGFAAGLVRTKGDILTASRLGTAVAALSVTKPGAASAMPTRAALRRFLRGDRTLAKFA